MTKWSQFFDEWSKLMDGLSAKITTIDELHEIKNEDKEEPTDD